MDTWMNFVAQELRLYRDACILARRRIRLELEKARFENWARVSQQDMQYPAERSAASQ